MSLAYMRGSTLFFLHASFFGFFSTFTPSRSLKLLCHTAHLLPLITLPHFRPAFPFSLTCSLIFRLPLLMRQQQTQTRRDAVKSACYLGREWRSSVSVCVSAKSLGVYLTLSSLEQSRYCPPKRSHHALLSVWENLMHGHTETHTKPKIIRNLCDKWSITSEHNLVFSGERYCSPSCYG